MTQLPAALQTRPLPQLVPGALLPFSMHTDEPLSQEVTPVAQAFEGWQVDPLVQETQLPARHTRLVPQEVPLLSDAPVSTQRGVPVEQSSSP